MAISLPATATNRVLVRLGTEPSDLVAEVRMLVGAGVRIDEALLNAAMRGWAYRMAGLSHPTSDPLVKFDRKAARNHLGVRQRQARAIRFKGDIADLDSPASGVCLAHLLKACRWDELGLRDAALLRIAHDTAAHLWR